MRKMITRCAIALTLLAGCYPSTRITGSWKSPAATAPVRHVFVAALTGNTLARSTVESEFAEALMKSGITVSKSMDEFPPSFSNDSVSKAAILDAVKKKGSDAILTVSLLKKETETRYVSGGYAPLSRWDYYGSFWGYYNYWYPMAYSPGYYRADDVHFMECNLYDARSQTLLWSAQSRTYSNGGLAAFAREYAAMLVAKMKSDGVVP